MTETMKRPELIGQTPEFLYVLDLDRTLINSRVAADSVITAAEEFGVSKTELRAEQDRIEAAKQPFDAANAIERLLSDRGLSLDDVRETMDSIKTRFLDIVRERDDLLYQGADELITELEAETIPFVIGTYGGQTWQQWKLEAAGLLQKDYIVTTTDLEKGSWIAREWRQDDGTYMPPFKDGDGRDDAERKQRFRARHIILVDDKEDSFVGLPPDCYSVLVRHAGQPILDSQIGRVKFSPHMVIQQLSDLVAVIKQPEERKT